MSEFTNQILFHRCDRCGKIYSIDERGHQTEKSDNCIYHFGRIYTNRGNRGNLLLKLEILMNHFDIEWVDVENDHGIWLGI